MGLPLLRTRFWIPVFRGMPAALFFCGCFFNDPALELEPACGSAALARLSAPDHFKVPRGHILESFGSFGCVSCPGAEARLLPYIHPELNSPGYNPRLIIVNYHVKFGSIDDPWVTSATQARYDQSFANSLPQVTLDGSNSRFGIRETDVNFQQGQYDSLIHRLAGQDSLAYLDLKLDTASLAYDTVDQKMRLRFTVLNRDTVLQGALSFRVLAVKNIPVTHPIYPDNPWEVIVAETTDRDTTGCPLVAGVLPPLTARSFAVSLNLPSESGKKPIPSTLENPRDYAFVIIAKDGQGVVRNAVSHKYRPR